MTEAELLPFHLQHRPVFLISHGQYVSSQIRLDFGQGQPPHVVQQPGHEITLQRLASEPFGN